RRLGLLSGKCVIPTAVVKAMNNYIYLSVKLSIIRNFYRAKWYKVVQIMRSRCAQAIVIKRMQNSGESYFAG
ncbi:MAG: hypothetical protein KDK05_24660, partial [Candidatus Competibacteraceae bacterium]|nr:hypothetical protein [Candidatus Competibacteraceae bacterium]